MTIKDTRELYVQDPTRLRWDVEEVLINADKLAPRLDTDVTIPARDLRLTLDAAARLAEYVGERGDIYQLLVNFVKKAGALEYILSNPFETEMEHAKQILGEDFPSVQQSQLY